MDQLRLLCVCCRVWMSATVLRVCTRVVFITQPPVNLNLDFQENIIIHLSFSPNRTAKISQQHRILIPVSFHVIALSWDILFFQTFVNRKCKPLFLSGIFCPCLWWGVMGEMSAGDTLSMFALDVTDWQLPADSPRVQGPGVILDISLLHHYHLLIGQVIARLASEWLMR